MIVADEPVSALDVSVQAQVLNVLRDLRDELGVVGVVAAILTSLALAGTAYGATTASTAIAVDAGQSGAPISAADFGADFLAPDGGLGAYDPATNSLWPSLLSQLHSSAYVGSLRFPGGITAESYDWERAIGPQPQRTDNPIGPSSGPSDSTVGPDEFGRLLDETGASGIVTTNFGTGTAAEAAAFVQYMTGRAGTSRWADLRAANGHSAPYDVPWWEVGNEEYSTDYWRTGTLVSSNAPSGADCPTVATCRYIYGGTTSFFGQEVVGYADRTAAASVSTGAAGQSFYVAYPPVVPGSATVEVGGQAWNEVASLAGAGPDDDDYTLAPQTGKITFGDGVHGAIPASGDTVTASYDSGPHDGFLAFYRAMKAANPSIHVCSTDTSEDFIEAMGAKLPYDCLQEHPYASTSDAAATLPLSQYESQIMTAPATEAASVQTLQSEISTATGRSVGLVLSEYGELIGSTPDPTQAPYYLNSLDEALLNASQLAEWIELGVPVADRQLLTAQLPAAADVADGLPGAAPFAVTGAITTPGPETVVQPTAEYVRLMAPLAGERLLSTRTSGNPTLATSSSGTAAPDLSVVSGEGDGAIDVVAINRSPTASLPATVSVAGVRSSGRATVSTLDGPSALSDNTADAPDTVQTTTATAPVRDGALSLTLPAHSISLIRIVGR